MFFCISFEKCFQYIGNKWRCPWQKSKSYHERRSTAHTDINHNSICQGIFFQILLFLSQKPVSYKRLSVLNYFFLSHIYTMTLNNLNGRNTLHHNLSQACDLWFLNIKNILFFYQFVWYDEVYTYISTNS